MTRIGNPPARDPLPVTLKKVYPFSLSQTYLTSSPHQTGNLQSLRPSKLDISHFLGGVCWVSLWFPFDCPSNRRKKPWPADLHVRAGDAPPPPPPGDGPEAAPPPPPPPMSREGFQVLSRGAIRCVGCAVFGAFCQGMLGLEVFANEWAFHQTTKI